MQYSWRKTSQALLPRHHVPVEAGQYDIYPAFQIGSGKIHAGYDALAAALADQRRVIIDGYGGVFWSHLRAELDAALQRRGVQAEWFDVQDALRSELAIERMVGPFLGGSDPLFGTWYTGTLRDFFDPERLNALQPVAEAPLSIMYGCGAALAGWDGLRVYVDLPKNEIQFRARAHKFQNLGCQHAADAKSSYKRCYFVDWPVLNQHKAALLPRVDLVVDEQHREDPAFVAGDDLRAALDSMSRSFFRVRPWFEPGPWGGQWIKQHVKQLPQDVPNYAWSFELIVPENGLLLESDSNLLEVSFDWLMFHAGRAVLGESAHRFGYEFPIRFDFLDTFDGGNLSVQCHPRPEYIQRHFGESFTQDETYYILDCAPDAQVYLGFRPGIDMHAFRAELERSQREGVPITIDRWVNTEPAHKHDLFLIPHGTVHCSGVNNLVLEISATPYIFTFKMYDWMRRDLEGNLRPLNIARAFENLDFERQGERVRQELVSQPLVLFEAPGKRVLHLPTHSDHFYDVHRLEFEREIEVSTDGSCHVLSLVEGRTVVLEASGARQRFSYAETFVVPAAAGRYRLLNEDAQPVKVVKAFIKPQAAWKGQWYDQLSAGD